ncbi:hypothetical protein K8I28_00780 [bacterium]|nr:hypothetical protein [bacterium]
MVDKVSRIYGPGSVQPANSSRTGKNSDKVEKRDRWDDRLHELEDRVEISAEGKAAAEMAGVKGKEVTVPAETREHIQDNWYSVGYRMAMDTVEESSK